MGGIAQVFQSKLTDVDTVQRDPLGSIRFEGNSIYKYVKVLNVTAAVSGAAGDPVAYENEDGYENNQVVVDLTDASSPPICAGFLMGTVTGSLLTSYYCWIKVKGPVTVVTAITSGADGVPVYLTSTDKTLAKAVEADSAGNYKQVAGIARDASAKTIIADCPL